MTSIYPASFSFCICTDKFPAVELVFSLINVNSASFTPINRLITASLSCECNMGSRSLNTCFFFFLSFYFFKLIVRNMAWNNVTNQYRKSMQQHYLLKCFYKQSPETYRPTDIGTEDRRFEI